jgi:hypothetical protein
MINNAAPGIVGSQHALKQVLGAQFHFRTKYAMKAAQQKVSAAIPQTTAERKPIRECMLKNLVFREITQTSAE